MYESFDVKDKKILFELDRNARQTDSEIAKKVGVSKQVANYRIHRLLKNNIINNFYSFINVGKLGLETYYVFFQLEGINKEEEQKLLEKLEKLSYVGWLVSSVGRWDVVLLLFADSISMFDKLLTNILNICGNHLHEYTFTTMLTAEHISYKFLSDDDTFNSVKQTEKTTKINLGETEKKILSAISNDARKSVVDISREKNIPIHKVTYSLKNMMRKEIIEGFKPKINVHKLNYQWHLLLIQFQPSHSKRKKEFISFCKQHDKVYYVTNTIGSYNIMLDVFVKSPEQFKEVLLELKDKFSNLIKLYESVVIFDEFKINYYPEELLRTI
jgi:DNA-binding Lrp family transcriptional regulator